MSWRKDIHELTKPDPVEVRTPFFLGGGLASNLLNEKLMEKFDGQLFLHAPRLSGE